MPNQKEAFDLVNWINGVLSNLDEKILECLLIDCCMTAAKELALFKPPDWRGDLEVLLQRSYRAGVCMYPSCKSFTLKFQCEQCPAQFCKEEHRKLAREKQYHFHSESKE